MNEKKLWAGEPTPQTDKEEIDNGGSVEIGPYSSMLYVDPDFARDLERRLRHALKLVGKLRADSECGDFDEDDLEQRLTRIEETLTP